MVYRPPNTLTSSFLSGLIDFLKNDINDINDDSYQLCVTGDFNLHYIHWESSCVSTGGSSGDQSSAEALFSFMSEYMLNQYVLVPTRGDNVLDIFLTNNDRLVINVSSLPTDLPDHNLVDNKVVIIISSNHLNSDQLDSPKPEFDKDSFRRLDFQKADYDEINQKLGEVDWDILRSLNCTFEEFPVLFNPVPDLGDLSILNS